MDHQVLSRPAMGPVVIVRETDVESQMVFAGRVHLAGLDLVEALGRLIVANGFFGAEFAGIIADRIGLEMLVAAVIGRLPHLELRLFLEDAHEDRLILTHAFLLQQRQRFWRERFEMWRYGLRATRQYRDRQGHESRS